MKKIKFNKKLFLNKDVVSTLNQEQIIGGTGASFSPGTCYTGRNDCQGVTRALGCPTLDFCTDGCTLEPAPTPHAATTAPNPSLYIVVAE